MSLVQVRFVEDRGRRLKGDVVSYDEVSAAAIVESGAAVLVDAPEPPGTVEQPDPPVVPDEGDDS